jgi:hypothetical protein
VASILTLDPDPRIRTLIELLVLRLGHRPIGLRGVAAGEKPDLLLLEPASSAAIAEAEILRRRLGRLPIVCVTRGLVGEAWSLDPAAVVRKPVRRSELEQAIADALVPRAYLFELPATA